MRQGRNLHPRIFREVAEIASDTLMVRTLVTRHADRLDVHELPVSLIRTALIKAWHAGFRAAASGSDCAETVGHVTFAMTEALLRRDESTLPGRYRYHLFGGFPGFCYHAATAGLVLAQVMADTPVDSGDWLDTIDRYANRVIDRAVIIEAPPCSRSMMGIARKVVGGAS